MPGVTDGDRLVAAWASAVRAEASAGRVSSRQTIARPGSAGHDRLAGSGFIRKEESEQRLRQHRAVDSGGLTCVGPKLYGSDCAGFGVGGRGRRSSIQSPCRRGRRQSLRRRRLDLGDSVVSSAATSISLMPPSSSRRKSVQRDAPAEGTAARTVKLKGLISITPVA